MKKTTDFIANRIQWSAAKHGLPSKTVHIFEALTPEVKAFYQPYFEAQDCGEIILLFQALRSHWTALGTKKLVGFDGKQCHYIPFESIENFDLKDPKTPLKSLFIQRLSLHRFYQFQLVVTDAYGKQSVFSTYKETDLYALSNLLLRLVRLYR